MRKSILMISMLMMFCAGMTALAQTIHVDHKFWDGDNLYTVKEIRMGKYYYMTTNQGDELTLEKVDDKQGEYKIIPSRQADECPFGAQFGWRVQQIDQDGKYFLAIRKPNGDVMWTMVLTTENEERCEFEQQMMGQEEPWNAVNSVLLNRAYLRDHVATKEELRLLRNKILAYHGYYFQSKDLQEYFSKIAWYTPVDDNSAIKLNIIEQTNLQLIKSEEAARAEAEKTEAEIIEREDREVMEAERKLSAEHRKDFHFDYELVKVDGDDFGSIVVKGYKVDDDSPSFECCHELVAQVSDLSATDVQWVKDSEDINFDGIPDLQVFLWYYTRGQVAEMYAAYVWTHQNKFEEVKQWAELCNPKIHPENKTVTENYRSDINERTVKTYKWNDDYQLELINTRKDKLFDE